MIPQPLGSFFLGKMGESVLPWGIDDGEGAGKPLLKGEHWRKDVQRAGSHPGCRENRMRRNSQRRGKHRNPCGTPLIHPADYGIIQASFPKGRKES